MNPRNILRAFAFTIVAALGFATPSEAAVTAFFSSGATCTGATSGAYTVGGGTFQVSLCANSAPEKLCGDTTFLQSALGESGRFNITARVLGPTFPNSFVTTTFPYPINNPNSAPDFGGFNPVPQAAGNNQLLATFTLIPTGSATANAYVISTFNTSVEVDADGTCGGALPTVTTPVSASFTINLNSAPTITSAASTTFTAGSLGTFNVTASGSPASTFAVTAGTLPAGINLSSAGVLSGTATATGVSTFTITATNGVAPAGTQSFTLTVVGGSQTITFANPGPKTFTLTPFASGATASSGLTVVLTSTTTTVCTVTGIGR